MAARSTTVSARPTTATPAEPPRFPAAITFNSLLRPTASQNSFKLNITTTTTTTTTVVAARRNFTPVAAIGDRSNSTGDNNINSKGKVGSAVPSSNYVVPLDNYSTGITRPLAEILRDLNKRIHDNIIVKEGGDARSSFIPWYHANRMLSFYAPGWCGEIRDVIFSNTVSVTVVYRVTVRGTDGEAHRESTGTVSLADDGQSVDPVAAAEEIAFCKACARFGLGLYLYHED